MMCALCGALGGGGHWTDTAAGAGERARRRERLTRASLANTVLRHYGLAMSDWQGSSYMLRSATGGSVMVDNLTGLWPAAEQLSGRRCDPLDEALLERLSALSDQLSADD
jgi:hypothetical protein